MDLSDLAKHAISSKRPSMPGLLLGSIQLSRTLSASIRLEFSRALHHDAVGADTGKGNRKYVKA